VKRSITIAVAAAAAFALAGCGTGIYSQTAQKVPSVPGVNATAPRSAGGTVSVRNATLAYPGVKGYQSGSDAKLQVWLFNDSPEPVTVTFRTESGTVTTASPVTIPADGYVNPDVTIKLSRDVPNVESVPVTVEFSGARPIQLQVPIDQPTAPAPAHTLEFEPGAGAEH